MIYKPVYNNDIGGYMTADIEIDREHNRSTLLRKKDIYANRS